MSDALSERLDAINGILSSIHHEYGKSTYRIIELGERNNVSLVKLSWHSIPVTLRFVLHTELVSLTIYIHLDRAPRSPDQNAFVSKLTRCIADITTMIDGDSCEHLQRRHKFLYDTIWKMFFREHKRIPPPSGSWAFPLQLENPIILANFRGLIIRLPSATGLNSDNIVSSLRPFLCCKRNVKLDHLAISEMKGGKALHCSNLDKPSDDQHHYLMLFSNSLNAKEVGKLIATGNLIAVLRFAAVIPRNKLSEAAHKLYQIKTEIDIILNSLGQTVTAEDRRKRLNDIRSTLFVQLNDLFDGDMRHRLLQSVVYNELLYNLLPRLGTSRLEPYNTHDEVVKNVLSPTLARIKRLLGNYDNVITEYYSVLQIVSAEETAEKNAEIKEMQEYAEFALIGFLLPYYIIGIMSHFIKEAALPYLSIGLWTSLLCYAFYNYRSSNENYRDVFKSGKGVLVPLCGMGVVLILCWAFSILHFPEEHIGQEKLVQDMIDGQMRAQRGEQAKRSEEYSAQVKLLDGLLNGQKELLGMQKEQFDAQKAEWKKRSHNDVPNQRGEPFRPRPRHRP